MGYDSCGVWQLWGLAALGSGSRTSVRYSETERLFDVKGKIERVFALGFPLEYPVHTFEMKGLL